MGFEILPILPNDFHNSDPLYDVFEISSAAQWTPSQFCLSPTCLPAHTSISCDIKNNTIQVATSNSKDLFFYDPGDVAICFPYEAANIVFDPTFVLAQLSHEFPAEITGEHQTHSAFHRYQENSADQSPVHTTNFFAYAVASWHHVLYDQIDPAKVAPYLGYRLLDIVKQTLQHTTQLARMVIRQPLRRHFKSCAPFLNVTCLDEQFFANSPSLHHGFTSA
jgi:hypothetical protein